MLLTDRPKVSVRRLCLHLRCRSRFLSKEKRRGDSHLGSQKGAEALILGSLWLALGELLLATSKAEILIDHRPRLHRYLAHKA